MEFILTPDMVGELAADGSITKHPALDIFGREYQKVNATRKYLTLGGRRVFVVIPTGKDSDENTYQLEGEPAPAPIAKPAAPVVLAEALKKATPDAD